MERAKLSSKARTRLLLHRIDGRLEARLRLIRQRQAARGAPVAACEAEVPDPLAHLAARGPRLEAALGARALERGVAARLARARARLEQFEPARVAVL